jgi:acetyl/propionyl-CoA carboxylase alpha subunit
MGLKTNLPFHQKLLDSTRFIAGRYDTQFVEQFMNIQSDDHELLAERTEAAAIMATLVEHQARQQALQFTAATNRQQSNWKWTDRRR